MLTIEDLGLRADARLEHMRSVAKMTADILSTGNGVAQVAFAPGDATQYQLLMWYADSVPIAGSSPWFATGADLVVTPLNLLPGRPVHWAPHRTEPAEILGRLGLTEHEHTANVYAAFLSLVAEAMTA